MPFEQTFLRPGARPLTPATNCRRPEKHEKARAKPAPLPQGPKQSTTVQVADIEATAARQSCNAAAQEPGFYGHAAGATQQDFHAAQGRTAPQSALHQRPECRHLAVPRPKPGAAVAPGGRLLALASLGLGCTACRFNRGRNPLVPFAFLVKMCHTET